MIERKAEKELGIDGLTDIERDTVREIDRYIDRDKERDRWTEKERETNLYK